MRIIVAGSRSITDYALVEEGIHQGLHQFERPITTVISGRAQGVDRLGEQYANLNDCNVELYPADWNQHGRSAGYKRNVIMAEAADALILIWDGTSSGSRHMWDIATKLNMSRYLFNPFTSNRKDDDGSPLP